MENIRVGVVGTGSIGKNHARIMAGLPGVAFTAIYDADEATARTIAELYQTRATSSLEEFASLVDAATIATPTPTHFPIAQYLLGQGKHCLVEKPITENTCDAKALAELAQRSGLVLQVGHIERFNPVLSALEARLNRPQFIEAHRLSPYPGRSIEIGVVLDLMIHDLEIVLHLVRSPVKYVDAVGIPVLSKGEDIANARIRFENGCVANLTASRISPEKMRKIRVFQNNAYLSLDYQNQTGEIYRLAGGQIAREQVEIDKGEPLLRELAAFVECSRAGAAPKVSGHQAAAALELAIAITHQIEANAPSPTLPPEARG
ncbi:MAG TPA: Gfo/Idh/MocA family oxidoreductase [Chthoniobacteraceae bacterium]|nr:Gfo/Idh/MocA family oxidoreductase [Chthoniobacteraceae bacterium]